MVVYMILSVREYDVDKLNDLAQQGWRYVDVLHTSVAFRHDSIRYDLLLSRESAHDRS